MPQPAKQPEWASGGGAQITEPTAGKKAAGYVAQEEPFAQQVNWLFNTIYQWTLYLAGLAGEAFTWTAAHIFQALVTFQFGIVSVEKTGNLTPQFETRNTAGAPRGGFDHIGYPAYNPAVLFRENWIASFISSDFGKWTQNTAYVAGNLRIANGALFECITAGTSSNVGDGPSTTVCPITDNTAKWAYRGLYPSALWTAISSTIGWDGGAVQAGNTLAALSPFPRAFVQPGGANTDDLYLVTGGQAQSYDGGFFYAGDASSDYVQIAAEWVASLSVVGAGNNTTWAMGFVPGVVASLGVQPTILMGFRKLSADTNWKAVTGDGGAETITDTGVPGTNNGFVRFRVEYHGSSTPYGARTLRYFVNGSLVATHTTHIATGQSMRFGFGGIRTGAASSVIALGPLLVEANSVV